MTKRALLFLILTSLACGETSDRDLPEPYDKLNVPIERLRSVEAQVRGAELFQRNCALCHGVHGDGRGLRSANLSGPARDLTSGAWRESATPRRVYHSIREGVAGTSMPAWKMLSGDETWDLVAYVLSLSDGVHRAGGR